MKNMRKKIIVIFILFAGMVFHACELEERILDSVVRDEAVLESSAVDPETALNPIYNTLASAMQNQERVFALSEHASDELIPPVRGTDWYDFGVWTTLHTHQWDPSHTQILNAWNTLHQGVIRANQAIVSTTDERQAQARFLRAYLVWQLLDLFGQVPYRDETDTDYLTPPAVMTRTAATTLVIDELEDIVADLPVTDYGNPTQAAAYALLAKVYLNKFIYDGTGTASSDDMDKVIEYAEEVTNDGYSLADGDAYFTDNFGVNNDDSPEAIFVLANESGSNRGTDMGAHIFMTMHYNQNPSGWNGFTTTADFYNRWDQDDKRFYADATDEMAENTGLHFGFLQGQQSDKDGNDLTQRNGSALNFTIEVPLTGATEAQGVRVLKYEPDFVNKKADGTFDLQRPANDLVLLRYADVYLMEAEAYFRQGDESTALSMMNTLRENRGVADLTTLTEDDILDERGFELYWEGHRRTDLIRFGQFGEEWSGKPASDASRTIYPIPQAAVDSNPNLKQNPDY